MELRREIEQAINRCGAEAGSDTPDWVLAEFLLGCLSSFDKAVLARTAWHGDQGQSGAQPSAPIAAPQGWLVERVPQAPEGNPAPDQGAPDKNPF